MTAIIATVITCPPGSVDATSTWRWTYSIPRGRPRRWRQILRARGRRDTRRLSRRSRTDPAAIHDALEAQ